MAFSEVDRLGSEYFMPIDRDIATWYSRGGKHLSMRPKDGLTWGDVNSAADLIFEVE